MLKQAVRNALFSGIATLGQFIVSFLFAGFTIRFLGDQRAGYLLTVQGVVSIASTMGGLGLGTAAVRKIASLHAQGNLSKSRQSLSTVFFVNLVMGVAVTVLLVLGFPWIFEWSRIDSAFYADAWRASVMLAMTFLVQQGASAYALVPSSLQRYDIVAVLGTVFGFLSGGLGLVVLTFAPSMSSLAALSLGLGIVQLTVNAVVSKRLLGGIAFPKWDWLELRSLSSFGLWAYLGSISGILVSNLDKVVLTTFLGSQALPYYVFGQRLYHQVHGALVGQSQYIFPMLSGSDQSPDIVRSVEYRLRWFVGFASAVAYGVFASLAYPLLSRVVGVDFANKAYIPFVLFCVVGFVHAQNIVPWNTSWAVGEGRPNSIMQLVNGALVLLTTIWLAPTYQVLGAVLAQFWIVPVVLVHVSWVLVLGKRFSTSELFGPILTPSFTFLLLLSLLALRGVFIPSSSRLFVTFVAVLVSIAVASLGLLLEQRVFQKRECVPTLWRASGVVLNRLKHGLGSV